MAKRIQTRIGNIYCVEIDNSFKMYFQYIAKDLSNLNGNVIRVFKTRYKPEDNPDMESIVSDEVSFYIETFISIGVYHNAWYYVGKSKNLGMEEASEIWFATKHYENEHIVKEEHLRYADKESWSNKIWKISGPLIKVPEIPTHPKYKLYVGGVYPYTLIVDKIRYGYFRDFDYIYDVIKRVPYDDVDSYTYLKREHETIYYHFKGVNLMDIITVDNKSGAKSVNGRDELPPSFYKLKFGDINWRNFITKEEYDSILPE